MRLDDLPTSDRIEDRRGLPGGRAGLGVGTVVILGLLAWAFGIDPRVLIGGAETMSRNGQTQQQNDAGSTGAPSDDMGRFLSAILGSTEVEWKDTFAQAGKTYEPPTLVMFSGATQSACGFAQAAMGPFYCPIDQKVYLDTRFFQDLERRFRACDIGSKTCQFSQAYVVAHEIGHHVQNQLGILTKVQEAQSGMDKAEANALQVRVELQADCLAGVWANRAQASWQFIDLVMLRLPCRPLRQSEMIVSTMDPGLRGARRIHPRHLGTTCPVVYDRIQIRSGGYLRHVSRRADLKRLES